MLILEVLRGGPYDFSALARSIRRVNVPWRTGIETLTSADRLEDVTIHNFAGSNLEVVRELPYLEFLYISSPGSCDLAIREYGSLPSMKRLTIEGATLGGDSMVPETVTTAEFIDSSGVDLSILEAASNLTTLVLRNCTSIPSLAPLEACRFLKEVQLDNTAVLDGNLGLIEKLLADRWG